MFSIKGFTRYTSSYILIFSNLIPVIGTLFFQWDFRYALVLYWSENLIVGFINVFKMILAQPYKEPQLVVLGKPELVTGMGVVMKFISIPFFAFHYGMFCLIHGMFVMLITFNFHGNPVELNLNNILQVFNLIAFPFLCLLISHVFSFLVNYVGKKEYLNTNVKEVMGQPYNRIIVVHMTILAGFFLLALFQDSVIFFLLLVVLKTSVDLSSHLKERKKFAANTRS